GPNNYGLAMASSALAKRDLEEHEEDLIPLPPYETVRAPIGPVIRSRRSVRGYSGKIVTLKELSTILYHGAGISGRIELENTPDTVTLGESDHIDWRTSISGGALYPIDLFVLSLNVGQLNSGAYRYIPKHHALKPIGSPELPANLRRLAQFGE